jgi:hypothetical protein
VVAGLAGAAQREVGMGESVVGAGLVGELREFGGQL